LLKKRSGFSPSRMTVTAVHVVPFTAPPLSETTERALPGSPELKLCVTQENHSRDLPGVMFHCEGLLAGELEALPAPHFAVSQPGKALVGEQAAKYTRKWMPGEAPTNNLSKICHQH